MIIATQSLNDLYSSNEAGKAIAENSAFYFLLHQKPETIDQVKEEKRLSMSEGGYKWLKSVYTQAGAFSEIFVKSEAGTGIGRLIVSDFQKLLYSTDPMDVQAINNYVNMHNLNYTQAINQVLIDRGLYHDFTPEAGQSPYLSQQEAKELMQNKISNRELLKLQGIYEFAHTLYQAQEELIAQREEQEKRAKEESEDDSE